MAQVTPVADRGAAAVAFQDGAQAAPDDKPMSFVTFDKGDFRYVVYAG